MEDKEPVEELEEDLNETEEGEGSSDPEPEEDTPDEEPEEEPIEETPDEEPPVRKSVKDYIIERKNKKIEKLQKSKTDDIDDEDYDESDTAAVIKREIGKALEPITSTLKTQADEKELQDTLSKYPEAKKMEQTIRRYAQSEAYSQVPIEFITRGLLANRANKKAQADQKAKGTRVGGHSRRPSGTSDLPDFSKMSDSEFEAWERKQHQGR